MDKRGGGYHVFPSKEFCLTLPRKFVEDTFCVSENIVVSKKIFHRKGISLFTAENFLSHSTETFRRGNLLCFRKFFVSKNFMDKKCKGEGVSRVSVGNILSHSTEKLPKGTLWCFRKFRVSKNILRKRVGGLSPFFSADFSSQSAENICGETLQRFR